MSKGLAPQTPDFFWRRKMQLPLRLSTAQELINKYSAVIDSYIYIDPDTQKNELLSRLYELKDKCSNIASAMLTSLGYHGSLKDQEKELNNNIKQLQQTTPYLNGPELTDFILKELEQAIPADPQFQKKYNEVLQNIKNELDLNDKPFEEVVRAIFAYLGHAIKDDDEIIITDGVARAKSGRDARGRFSLSFSEDFYKSSALLQDLVLSKMRSNQTLVGKIKAKRKKIKGGFEINIENDISEDNILNWLRHTKEIAHYLSENSRKKINDLVMQRIVSAYQGDVNNTILRESIEEIINASGGYVFFIGDSIKDMTGILGEIQGLYYIKSLIKNNNKSDEAAVRWVGGLKNPHADLVLTNLLTGNKYGIQIKNTSREGARQDVMFESFKSSIVTHNTNTKTFDFSWLKEESSKNWSTTLQQNPEIFNAATQFLAMEQFNIPYQYVDGKAYEVTSVPTFELTRRIIEEEAERSRKVLASFLCGMMYMQLEPTINKDEASTLYLIGGTLAITSASILMDIINSLEKNIRNFNFTLEAVGAHKGTIPIGTIVEFLNAGEHNHEDRTKFVLQSSYTFWK